MNAIDLGVIALCALYIFAGYRRGLVLSLYSACGWIVALLLARQVYPYVNQYLQDSFVYEFVYGLIANHLNLDSVVAEHSVTAQNDIISALGLPDFIASILQSGNTPVLYELFKATNITEYIYSYLSVLCINILSMVLSFMVISVVMKVLLSSLNIVTKLPVIHTLNRIGGIAAGALNGLLIAWIILLILSVPVTIGAAPWLSELLRTSVFANRFFDAGFLLRLIHLELV